MTRLVLNHRLCQYRCLMILCSPLNSDEFAIKRKKAEKDGKTLLGH